MIFILAIIGLCITLVTIYVQFLSRKKSYKPFCSINSYFDCKTVIQSPRSRLLGFKNSYAGLGFYAAFLIIPHSTMQFLLASIGLAVSIILVYSMFFELRKVCVLCMISHIVNFLLFSISLANYISA